MNLSPLLTLLFSLSGFLFGLILSLIAPEELPPGKKYFILIKQILFYSIILFSLFLFVYFEDYPLVLIPLIYSILYVTLIKKQKTYLEEIFNYSFFILIFIIFLFVDLNSRFLLLFLSLLFLYGFPAGTLFKISLTQKYA